MTWSNIKTIKNKLIFYTTIAISVYLIGCIIFFAAIFPTQFSNSQKKLNNNIVSVAKNDISSILVSARNLYLNISDDFETSELFSGLYEESKKNKAYTQPTNNYIDLRIDAKNTLLKLVNYNNQYINSIAVVCDDNILISTQEEIPSHSLLNKLSNSGNKISFFSIPHSDKSLMRIIDTYVISFPYTISKNVEGYICFFIKTPHIFSDDNSIIYILDENGCVFSNNQILDISEEKTYYDEWRSSAQTISQGIDNKTYFVSTVKIDLYNWTLVNLLESNSFTKTVKNLMLLIASIIALGIILMMFLSSILSSSISHSIMNISAEIDEFIEQLQNNVFIQKKHLRNSHLYNFSRKFTLKKKLWIYFICVVLLPILVISTTIGIQTCSLVNTEFETKSKTLFSNIENSLSYTFNEYNSALSTVITNDEITSLLDDYYKTDDPELKAGKYMNINNKIYNSSYVWNNAIFSFFDDKDMILTIPNSHQFNNDDFYHSVNQKFITRVSWNSTKQSYNLHFIKYIYMLKESSDSSIKYGAISISPETLTPTVSAISNDCLFYLSDKNGTIFFSNTLQSLNDLKNNSSNKNLIINNQMEMTPLDLTISFPRTDVNSANTVMLIYITLLVLCVILCILLIINLFNNHIVNHASYVNIILNTDSELPEHKCNDELDLLTISAKNMKEQLRNLIDQVYKHKILETELQLKAMQSQITPHFLYNTLEIISSLIQIKDDRAVDLTLLLSDFFRQGISRGQSLLPLKHEISYTNVYLDIHRIILGDKLKICTNIAPELENNVVINFSLQPVLENTLKHGMYLENDTRIIKITSYHTSDFVKIAISDNGCGMSRRELEQLRQSIYSQADTENIEKQVGLKNVHERIKLYFGENYGLKIHSVEGKGTMVVLKIPHKDI